MVLKSLQEVESKIERNVKHTKWRKMIGRCVVSRNSERFKNAKNQISFFVAKYVLSETKCKKMSLGYFWRFVKNVLQD